MCNFYILCASAQGRDSKEDERARGSGGVVSLEWVSGGVGNSNC